MLLEMKIWVLGVHVATRVFLFLGPLSWNPMYMLPVYLCLSVSISVYSFLCVCVCVYVCVCVGKHEFILMSQSLIHYDIGHASLLPLLFCNLPLQQWESWLPSFTIHLLSCLIPLYMHSCVSVLLTWTPVAAWSARIQYSCTVPFVFSFTDYSKVI